MEQVEEKQLFLRYLQESKNLGTEKSKIPTTMLTKSKPPLHNFSLPGGLRWGNQRFLRCVKVNSTQENDFLGQFGSKNGGFGGRDDKGSIFKGGDDDLGHWGGGFCGDGSEKGLKGSKVGVVEGDDDIGIAAVREKVILDLQNAADKMKEKILGRGSFEDVTGEGDVPGEGERGKPWNLRTRRSMNRPVGSAGGGGDGVVGGGKNLKLDMMKANGDALGSSGCRVAGETSLRRRSGEKKEREKFSVALGPREIEEDFMAMVGHKPPRRPKKRAKYVQKQLDTLFPGLWLTEITADMYKVTEIG